MATIKKFFISVALAFVMMFTGITALYGMESKQAKALTPTYTGQSNTIYYFSDFYPTIDHTSMVDAFGTYNIVYDRQNVGEFTFTDMVANGYFSGFGNNCVVIIDIKGFRAPAGLLQVLFSSLKNQGCKTMFVTVYTQQSYAGSAFLNYVDVFYESDFGKLRTFVHNSILDMSIGNEYLENTCFLLDGNLINISNDYSMDLLCSNSIFLRIFMEELASILGITYSTHSGIVGGLRNYNITLLVHKGSNQYVDIVSEENGMSGILYTVDSVGSLIGNGSLFWEYICAVGFWELDGDFYDFLLDGQETLDSLPIYLLEADPFNYSDEGLQIISDSELADMYGVLPECDEEDELISELTGLRTLQ